MKPLFICTDLDRTLIPNGHEAESPMAREIFRHLSTLPEVSIAYVTGRSFPLTIEAISRFELPQPDCIVCDVGTRIFVRQQGLFLEDEKWSNILAKCWPFETPLELDQKLRDTSCTALTPLTLQEPEKQSRFKLSYYFQIGENSNQLVSGVKQTLDMLSFEATVVGSIDEVKRRGLLDILPIAASKLRAVEHLISKLGHSHEQTIFSGDSGNDLDVMISHLPSVLVANASTSVKEEAHRLSHSRNLGQSLYVATGGYLGMNGNYSAGIIEGVAHFFPDYNAYLLETCNEQN
ncbi:MAG: HAD-IIB family hydrolase [bacterium]|nr:HAD-IIB family hydrolase [bacterium]